MRKNATKQRLKNNEPSFGMGLLWPSPELAELAGSLGFDWLWLDVEHGPFDLQALSNVVRAAESVGVDSIARIAKTRDPEQVLKYLETGIMGVIVPHAKTKEDIEFAVDAVKYPPVGHRSAGVMRPAGWGSRPSAGHYAASNEETMVMALVEEVEGLENIDEMLSVPGLDAVVIGFGDLSLTMGHPGEKNHPDVMRVATAAMDKILASDVALQVTVQNGEEAREWVQRGSLMLRCTMQQMLVPALKNWLQVAKS